MKKVFLLILACSLTSVFAQPAKTRKRVPKTPAPPVLLRSDLHPDAARLNDEEAVKRILDPFAFQRKDTFAPIAFNWMINEETTLPAGTLYREFIRFNSHEAGRIVRYFAKNSVTVKKNSESKDNNLSTVISSSVEYLDCAISVEKNVVFLTNQKIQGVEKYRVFLDKKKKKILKIQNLKTNRIYKPSKSNESAAPSIGI